MKKPLNLFLNLHLSGLCLATMTLMLLVLPGCKSKEPSSADDNGMPSNDFHNETGMYVGITGFGENVSFYKGVSDRYNILSELTIGGFTNFVNNLGMTDATVLYYAVDNNLDYLTKCQFPSDLSSVNIVTFTDGLNQGSRALDRQDGNHDYTSNDKDYVNAVNNKLKTFTIQGHSVNAYTIGIRGKDVQGDAVATFKDNLVKLSSSSDNATEVSNMDGVNAKFKEIAKSLYKQNSSSSMSIVIPMPSDGESERFTFDDVSDASASKCYLEGVYEGGSLSNIVYVGCGSTAGNRVVETSAGGVKISFEFPSLVDDTGDAVSSKKMQQWHKSKGSSTWVRNSEFKPQESTIINVERKSAVIMLILDCSSSLGSDFAKMKESAKEFLKILAVGSSENGLISVQSIILSKTSHSFSDKGQTMQLTATVSPSNATFPEVTWQSSNTSVATVSDDGLVTCTGFGTATITATADGMSATCAVSAKLNLVTDACGISYKYITIGSQVWMAENMRCNKYDTQSERAGATLSTSSNYTYAPYYTDGRNATTSYSGNLTSEHRSKLGYLYNWAAAVGLASESAAENQASSFSGNRQGICPNGWHVPTDAEWSTLKNYVGSNAGTKLKATSGWYSGGNCTDDYSFAALPAGYAGGSTVGSVGSDASFWTATPDNIVYAYYRALSYDIDDLGRYVTLKSEARSVRCVRN